MNAYVIEECLFTLLLKFDSDIRCFHQLLDLLLALLQVDVAAFLCVFFHYLFSLFLFLCCLQ